ncbi:MAG: hypothetical protein U0575_11920 [Phycisphaerales bacterium]
MDAQSLFEQWAPTESFWSAWAKPSLFARSGRDLASEGRGAPPSAPGAAVPGGGAPPPPNWLRHLPRRAAIVVDLPGAEAVHAGVALAVAGFRPVPLFNTTANPAALVDVKSVVAALIEHASAIGAIAIDADAAPAFLIDCNRAPGTRGAPGRFDNRWIVFPQDFPSGEVLRANGIEEAIVVRDDAKPPAADLLRVLATWRAAGLRVDQLDRSSDARPCALDMRPRRFFGPMLAMATVFLGLRRNSAGGFGAWIPVRASGHGIG